MAAAPTATIEHIRQQVSEALDTVIDPCSSAAGAPAGLEEMGLIRKVDIALAESGARVEILVGVTHPSCFMAPVFLQQVREAVVAIPGVDTVDTSLDDSFEWSPDDMSTAYRERLANHRASRGLPITTAT
jgi:metal-sulfur cluster biosynthetic enzyme